MTLFRRRSTQTQRAVGPTYDQAFSRDVLGDGSFTISRGSEAFEKYGLSVVYGAVSLISGQISSLPIVIEREATGKATTRPSWVDKPDLAKVAPLTMQDLSLIHI